MRSSEAPCQEVGGSFPLPVWKTAVESRHVNMVLVTVGTLCRRTRLTPRVPCGPRPRHSVRRHGRR
jgi:hypothetical protein